MIYQAATARQPKVYGANIEYFDPEGTKRQIGETVRNYCTFAFKPESDWDEEEKISARKAHENAEAMLRTMFNDLPEFKNKNTIKKCLQRHHSLTRDETSESLLLDDLVRVCEERLKGTTKADFCKQFSKDTPEQLKEVIEPYLNTPAKFSKPVFWPLILQVRYNIFSQDSALIP
jgi:hypothetical protein